MERRYAKLGEQGKQVLPSEKLKADIVFFIYCGQGIDSLYLGLSVNYANFSKIFKHFRNWICECGCARIPILQKQLLFFTLSMYKVADHPKQTNPQQNLRIFSSSDFWLNAMLLD